MNAKIYLTQSLLDSKEKEEQNKKGSLFDEISSEQIKNEQLIKEENKIKNNIRRIKEEKKEIFLFSNQDDDDRKKGQKNQENDESLIKKYDNINKNDILINPSPNMIHKDLELENISIKKSPKRKSKMINKKNVHSLTEREEEEEEFELIKIKKKKRKSLRPINTLMNYLNDNEEIIDNNAHLS